MDQLQIVLTFDWEAFLEQLRTARQEHLQMLEDSFVTLRAMSLLSSDGSIASISKLQTVMEFITRTDGSLQGVLEAWASYKTTVFSLYHILEVAYESAIDETRGNISSLRLANMSWAERDAYCRLENKELHTKVSFAKLVVEFINNTMYEIKARQKYLYAKRQSIDSMLSTIRLQLRLQEL